MRFELFSLTLGLAALVAPARGEDDTRLLSMSGRAYSLERIGTLTNFHCAKKEKSQACDWIEQLDLQPQVDWTGLLERAKNQPSKKKPAAPIASETVIDRFGGPWVISLYPVKKGDVPAFLQRYKATVVPDFSGYIIQFSGGKPASADVVRQKEDWDAAKKELGREE